MLPELLLLVTLASNILILVFIAYYLIILHNKEKLLVKKENDIDSSYHHVVDEALNQERTILTDATSEADKIIAGAQYLSNSSKQDVGNAIKTLVAEIQKEGQIIAQAFSQEYSSSLKKLSGESLNDFQTIMSLLQTDLKKQIQDFHSTLLPQVEKELEIYKQTRMQEIDKTTAEIIQKASQEIFNKSISLTDHQNMIVQSLEKAKKEGVFD